MNRSKGLLPLYFLVFSMLVFAADARGQSQQATVVNQGALVYQSEDFDAPVISTLKRGDVYAISTVKKGPFYKIRIKPGVVGWIADTDVKTGVHRVVSKEKNDTAMKPLEDAEKLNSKKRRPFVSTRYRGFAYDSIYYTEDTIGGQQSEYMPFYGMKIYGNDTLFDGEIYTESNLLFSLSAPQYYQALTNRNASGFIFIADFLFQTVSPQGKEAMTFYGFGPMVKYSQFNLEVPNGTKSLSYSATDMSIGAVFNLGAGFRIQRFALRADVKYYWEKSQYYGFGFNAGMDF